MAKKNKIKVEKLYNGRVYELTPQQFELWKAGRIKMKVLELPVKVEDIPDVLKEVTEP